MIPQERRNTRSDRRIEDVGPPSGWRDRRKRVERRIPMTEEIEVSEAEWLTYFGGPARQSAVAAFIAHHEHVGTEIPDRVRD